MLTPRDEITKAVRAEMHAANQSCLTPRWGHAEDIAAHKNVSPAKGITTLKTRVRIGSCVSRPAFRSERGRKKESIATIALMGTADGPNCGYLTSTAARTKVRTA